MVTGTHIPLPFMLCNILILIRQWVYSHLHGEIQAVPLKMVTEYPFVLSLNISSIFLSDGITNIF